MTPNDYLSFLKTHFLGHHIAFPASPRSLLVAMPEPSATELAKEAEQEAAVFALNVEKLLNTLRALNPAKDNLADDEEMQVRTITFSCSLCCQCSFF